MYSVLNTLSEYMYILLHIKKHYFIHFCSLFLKSTKAFSISLNLLGTPTFLKNFKLDLKVSVTIIVKKENENKKDISSPSDFCISPSFGLPCWFFKNSVPS